MKNELTAKRLRKAMSDMDIKAQELSEKSGVSKYSISQYVNGKHVPSNISAGLIASVLGVDPVWLMGFDVPMKQSDQSHEQRIDIAEIEQSLIQAYRAADPGIKEAVRKLLDIQEKGNEKQELESYSA